MSLLRDAAKLFRRNIFLLTCFILLLILSNGYEFYLLITGVGQSPLNFMQTNQSISLLSYLFFLVVSYEYYSMLSRSHLSELHRSVYRGEARFYLCQSLILFFLLSIMVLSFLCWETGVYLQSKVGGSSYYIHLLKNYLLNFMLPGIVACMVGFCLSNRCKRLTAYLVIIVLAFLNSPVSAQLPVVFDMLLPYGASVPIYRFFDLFSLCPRGLSSEADYAYGLPIESYRWQIAACAVFLLLGIIILLQWRRYQKAFWKSCGIAAMILAVLCGASSFVRGSVQIYDDRPDGITLFDQGYYIDHPGKVEAAGFEINAYQMELTLKSTLKADVTLQLSAEHPCNVYIFTLHHSLKIKSVEDGQGKALQYRRDGDYLDIYPAADSSISALHIVYEGFSPIFYTNAQGVYLPGYYSYYPMAGYHRIYETDYNVSVYSNPKQFDVRLHAPYEIISNLPQDTEGRLSGEAEAMTLVAGFLQKETVEGAAVWNTSLRPYDDREALTGLSQTIRDFNSLLGADLSYSLQGKTIFHTNSGSPADCVLGDHIIGSTMEATEIAAALVDRTIPGDAEKAPLRELLINDLRFGGVIKARADSDYESDKTVLAKQTAQAMQTHGEAAVYRAIYQYLIDESDRQTPEQFWDSLNQEGTEND